MAKLIFKNSGDQVDLDDNSPIAEPCEAAGLPFACTEGVCGTCVFEPDPEDMSKLSEPTQEEIDFLGEEGVCRERLACQCKIKQGIVKITF